MSSPPPTGAGSLEAVTATLNTERTGLRRRAHRLKGVALPSPLVSALSPAADPALVLRPPAVLVVAESASVRNAVARELARDFELINAVTFASAVRKLSARPAMGAIIVDLALADRHGASWFLARLVARAYAGPRILLSGAMGPDHASSMRRGSVSHFTLTSPWLWGELRASLVTAMGSRAQPLEMTRGSRWDESGAP